MRTRFALFLILAGVIFSGIAYPAGDRFDGNWDAKLTCEDTDKSSGYTYTFRSAIKNSELHGEKGKNGKPGWLLMEGKIDADGTAKLNVDGIVANANAAGGRASGTEYHYQIDANFTLDAGSGKRTKGRACTVEFTKTR
jgi:hypothetical protein